MDEQTAWSCFARTGSVQDYLRYAQCRVGSANQEEKPVADTDRGSCDPGSGCRGE